MPVAEELRLTVLVRAPRRRRPRRACGVVNLAARPRRRPQPSRRRADQVVIKTITSSPSPRNTGPCARASSRCAARASCGSIDHSPRAPSPAREKRSPPWTLTLSFELLERRDAPSAWSTRITSGRHIKRYHGTIESLAEVLEGDAKLEEALIAVAESLLMVLPVKALPSAPSELLSVARDGRAGRGAAHALPDGDLRRAAGARSARHGDPGRPVRRGALRRRRRTLAARGGRVGARRGSTRTS